MTLQCGPYKGHISFCGSWKSVWEECFGVYPDQLTPRDIDTFVENECNMEIDPTRRILHFDLTSEELNSTQHYEIPCMDAGIDNMVVAVEIIESKPYKRKK